MKNGGPRGKDERRRQPVNFSISVKKANPTIPELSFSSETGFSFNPGIS